MIDVESSPIRLGLKLHPRKLESVVALVLNLELQEDAVSRGRGEEGSGGTRVGRVEFGAHGKRVGDLNAKRRFSSGYLPHNSNQKVTRFESIELRQGNG